jgi:hypothetical protein
MSWSGSPSRLNSARTGDPPWAGSSAGLGDLDRIRTLARDGALANDLDRSVANRLASDLHRASTAPAP